MKLVTVTASRPEDRLSTLGRPRLWVHEPAPALELSRILLGSLSNRGRASRAQRAAGWEGPRV